MSADNKTSTSDTVQKHKDFLFPAVTMYYQEPLALDHGEGMYIWDESGQKYLDCFGGVLTTSVGHASRSSAKVPRQKQAPIANSRSGMIVRMAIEISPSSMPR